MSTEKKIVIIAGPNGAGKTTSDPDEAIARVALRVRQGGHDVPPEAIRRRFATGLKNFTDVYRYEVDYWRLFDNSGQRPRLLSQGGSDE